MAEKKKSALQVKKPTTGDYLSTLKDLLVVNPRNSPAATLGGAAYDYATKSTPRTVVRDIRSGVQGAEDWLRKQNKALRANPVTATLQLLKAGYIDPLAEPFRVFQQAATERSRGNESGAAKLAAMVPLAVAGVLPQGRGAGKLAAKAGVEAATKTATKKATKAATPSMTVTPKAKSKPPSLLSAVRVGGKTYTGPTHLDALDAIPDPKVRSQASLDANSRGFVNERGKYMDRFKAADYARNFDLFAPDAPDWAKTAPEVISENLRLPENAVTPKASVPSTARLKRAQEQGFNTELPLYHGTSSDFPEFSAGREIFLTDKPDIANIYAVERGKDKSRKYGPSINSDPNVRPVFAKMQNPLVVSDVGPDGSHGWLTDNMAAALGVDNTSGSKLRGRALYDEARRQGYDTVQIENMLDLGGEQTQYVPLSPDYIKSQFDAFEVTPKAKKKVAPVVKGIANPLHEVSLEFGSDVARRLEGMVPADAPLSEWRAAARGIAGSDIPNASAAAPSPYSVRPADVAVDPRIESRKGELGKIANLEMELAPRVTDPAPEVSIFDYEGHPYITSMSDLAAAGDDIVSINGERFRVPFSRRGGQDYMFDNPGSVWASERKPAERHVELADQLQQMTGKDVLYMPWTMGPNAVQFSHMPRGIQYSYADAALGGADRNALAAGIKDILPDWRGFEDPGSAETFMTATGSARGALNKLMDTFRTRGGLGKGEATYAATDLEQMNTPLTTLRNVGIIDPRFAASPSSHASYNYSIPGRGVGRLKENIGALGLSPDVMAALNYETPFDFPVGVQPGTKSPLRAMQMKPQGGILDYETLRFLEGLLEKDKK